LLSSVDAAFSGEFDGAYVEFLVFLFMEFRLESEFHVFTLGFDGASELHIYQHVGWILDRDMASFLDLEWHLEPHVDCYVAYVVVFDLEQAY
jgi:hypothetical protein